MSRKEALADMIAQIEAGVWPGKNVLHEINDTYGFNAWRAYEGSLDGAKLLHEAMLPDWIWDVGPQNDAGQISACVTLRSDQSVQSCETVYHNPARAWLLAILRALHSMEPDT